MGVVREIAGRKALAQALMEIRAQVYRDLPGWHAPPAFLELDRFDRAHDPFWDSHDGQSFVFEDGGRVRARVTAFVPKAGGQTGRFGVFDSVDDAAAAGAVLDAAARWLAARGATRMEGPYFFSMHEEAGLLVGGFELPSSIYMPFNPPHYARLLEQAGFAPIRRFRAFRYDLDTCYAAAVSRVKERPGLTVRSFDLSRETEETTQLLDVYNSAFSANWGFTPLSGRQGRALIKNLLTIGDSALVRVAELEGKPIGFILCVPDVNSYLHAIRGWPDLLKVPLLLWGLWRRKIVDCRVITLAVVKELQGQGLSRHLIRSLASTAKQIGYRNAELSYVDTENRSMNSLMEGYEFRTQKEYRVFGKDLTPGSPPKAGE